VQDQETVVIRPRRQITLPRDVCEALGVKPGDRLVLVLEEGRLVVRAEKQAALGALESLRRGFAETGLPLEELLAAGRRVRDELFREKYRGLVEGPERPGTQRRDG
jgi:AbrB family looped-hinge helix DNA binding protein